MKGQSINWKRQKMKVDITEKQENHPFPNKELYLLMKLNSQRILPKEEFEIISNLLKKYLDLRASVFHED